MSANPEPTLARDRPALPSGTVTFAFTDIEGSTQRWDRNRAAMERAVRAHDGLMREPIGAHGGHVFKTLGDAFCAAFWRPEDAVAAMVDAQRAIAASDFTAVDGLRVRMALHTGTADERDGDYFGPAVNRVARLLAIGHGGQVLVSGVTADLVAADLPAQASLRGLGEHSLKDLSRPEHVQQLLAPGLAADFPPLRSLDVLANNLPRVHTSLVGREREVAEITDLIDRHQLVTLVGAGGVGKTRVSLQVAANLVDGSGDGVWFIELAPLQSGEHIPATVANALDLTLSAEGDPVANLARALKAKRALLVFDNCEHVVEQAARAIAAIMQAAPRVKILASSRQGLGVAGEVPYRVPSLSTPSPNETSPLLASDAARYSALALFQERASIADREFHITDDNVATVADICRRLDGIPLAIELAAARAKILSPKQLRDRLDERFRVLTGGRRDALPRQQTLRALIDWSYDLLEERERALFRRLGMFVDGFTLEGAVAVGEGAQLDEFEVFELLASLVDKSLVLAERIEDAVRYRLLESTRAYAREKLESAAELDVTAGAHLSYLRNRGVAEYEAYDRTARPAPLDEFLRTELEDLRAALDWALARPEGSIGAELLAATAPRWNEVGSEIEALGRLEAYLSLGVADSGTTSRLLNTLALLASHRGQDERSSSAARQSVEHARIARSPALLAMALVGLSQRLAHLGTPGTPAAERFHAEARAALEEAEGIGDMSPQVQWVLLNAKGFLSSQMGDFDHAARSYEAAARRARSLGNVRLEITAIANLAEQRHNAGSAATSIALITQILPKVRAHGNLGLLTHTLCNYAGYLVSLDRLAEARDVLREVIRGRTAADDGDFDLAIASEHLALALALLGEPERGARLRGFVDAIHRRLGWVHEFNEKKSSDRLIAILNETLAAEVLAARLAEGAALSVDDAVALALADP